MTNKERFLQLVSHHDPKTMELNRWRVENRYWIRESQQIAMAVIFRLEALGWTQKQLSDEMNVSPQYISKLLSGQENLTLETLMKLQIILDIPLLATSQAEHINQLTSTIAKLEKKVQRLNEKLKDQKSSLPAKPNKKTSKSKIKTNIK